MNFITPEAIQAARERISQDKDYRWYQKQLAGLVTKANVVDMYIMPDGRSQTFYDEKEMQAITFFTRSRNQLIIQQYEELLQHPSPDESTLGPSGYIDARMDPPRANGKYFALMEGEMPIGAMYYVEENRWESMETGQHLDVLLYQHIPSSGMKSSAKP